MTIRMTSTQVVFQRPFMLTDFAAAEPAGTYTVETEEESIDDVSFLVWKRLATIMHIVRGGATEYVRIDPVELHEALLHDGGLEETRSGAARQPPRHP